MISVLFSFLANGCGYSTGTLIRDDIDSVSVKAFDNTTFYRGLEVDLTRHLTEELRMRTPLKIAEGNEADSTLSGSLVDYSQNIVTETEDEEILLRRISVTVEFRWTDNFTGKELVEPQTFTESNTFALSRQEDLREEIFRDTAETIIENMEQGW